MHVCIYIYIYIYINRIKGIVRVLDEGKIKAGK